MLFWSYYIQLVLMNMCMQCEQFLIESTVSSRCWKGSQTLFYQALKCTFAALYERVLCLLLWKFAGDFVQASSWHTARARSTYGNTHSPRSIWKVQQLGNPNYRSIPISRIRLYMRRLIFTPKIACKKIGKKTTALAYMRAGRFSHPKSQEK